MTSKERTYSDAEVTERLKQELPHWYLENGWIRRKYRTHSWKGTLMVINTVGHLAEAAWHHPDITASYAWVEVRLQNHAAKGRAFCFWFQSECMTPLLYQNLGNVGSSLTAFSSNGSACLKSLEST